MIIGSASVWNMNKKKMCKKSEASERNVQEEQKFSTCMICLDVNESLEEVALRKNQTTFLKTQEFKEGCGPKVNCL
jgi:hypothetical protein